VLWYVDDSASLQFLLLIYAFFDASTMGKRCWLSLWRMITEVTRLWSNARQLKIKGRVTATLGYWFFLTNPVERCPELWRALIWLSDRKKCFSSNPAFVTSISRYYLLRRYLFVLLCGKNRRKTLVLAVCGCNYDIRTCVMLCFLCQYRQKAGGSCSTAARFAAAPIYSRDTIHYDT